MTMLHKILANDDGATIVELALISPVLVMFIAGTVDLSNGFSRRLQLEQAAQRAVEKVMQTTGEATVENTLQSEAATQAGVPVDNVTVTYRVECNQVDQNNPDADCPAGQDQARYMQVTVRGSYTTLFPPQFLGRSSSEIPLVATAGMRTQ